MLSGDDASAQRYSIYSDLMTVFKQYVDSDCLEDKSILVNWFQNDYTLSEASNIDILCYKMHILSCVIQKICVYCILAIQLKNNLRDSLSNKTFFDEFGMCENILNKWYVSTQYLFLANRDTYSALRIDRNGVKKPYLTRSIKKEYYESVN